MGFARHPFPAADSEGRPHFGSVSSIEAERTSQRDFRELPEVVVVLLGQNDDRFDADFSLENVTQLLEVAPILSGTDGETGVGVELRNEGHGEEIFHPPFGTKRGLDRLTKPLAEPEAERTVGPVDEASPDRLQAHLLLAKRRLRVAAQKAPDLREKTDELKC